MPNLLQNVIPIKNAGSNPIKIIRLKTMHKVNPTPVTLPPHLPLSRPKLLRNRLPSLQKLETVIMLSVLGLLTRKRPDRVLFAGLREIEKLELLLS